MSETSEDKLLGFIPKARYTYLMYVLVLCGAGIGVLASLIMLVGIYPGPLGNIGALMGLGGLILALLGVFLYKEDFSELDRSHFIYVAIVYAAMWVAAVFFGSALAFVYILGQIAVVAISIVGAVLIFTGYNSWRGGRMITKDNLQSEVKIALKRP